ncbi:MAG: hypothetical protein ACQGVK_18345 [Myxococcota bacterium]
MSTQTAAQKTPVRQIVVRLDVGDHRMSATDDPVFLRVIGPCGRDFRLAQAKGRFLRRGKQDVFVIGTPKDPDTSLAHPELNDPTSPPLWLEGIDRISLWKGLDPLPNVRGLGEMDDRLMVDAIEVQIHAEGLSSPARYQREGPIWLGLLCGHSFEIPRVEEAS